MSSVCEDFRAAWTSTWSWHRSTFASVSLSVRPRHDHWITMRVFVVRSCEYCRKGFLHRNQLYAHHKQYHPNENESKVMLSLTTTGCFMAERRRFNQGVLSFLDQRTPEDLWVCTSSRSSDEILIRNEHYSCDCVCVYQLSGDSNRVCRWKRRFPVNIYDLVSPGLSLEDYIIKKRHF